MEEIIKSAFENWDKDNNQIGVKRKKLVSYFPCKIWKANRIIAKLKKEKRLCLYKRYYFASKIEVLI